MNFPVIAALIILLGFLTGFVVSLYAACVNGVMTNGEMQQRPLSKRAERLKKTLAADPRLLNQIATLYKSMMLAGISGVSIAAIFDMTEVGGWSRTLLTVTGLLILWSVYILLVELLPGRLSRRQDRKLKLRYGWIISLIFHTLAPLGTFIRRSIRQQEPEGGLSEEEIVERAIESLADQAGIEEPIIEADEKEMIGHIFQLDQTVVREIMVPRTKITAFDINATLVDIKALVKKDGHSRYPIYTGTIDSIAGILYVKDIFSNINNEKPNFVITDYLRKPYLVPESKVIGELLREFKAKKVHIAMVVDEYGGLAGLVTLEDILEEIVGEIRDEHDAEEDVIKSLPDGSFLLDAGLLVEELQEYLHTDYPQGEYDTVSGLIYDLVGSVPKPGSSVKWYSFEFEIDQVDGQRITRVRLLPLAKP